LFNGEHEETLTVASEGASLAAKVGHIGTENLCSRMVALGRGVVDADLDALERAAIEELPVYESINSPWIALSHAWLSNIHATRGRFDEALHHAEESMRLMPPSSWTGLGEASKVLALAVSGQREACLAMLDDPAVKVPSATEPTAAGQHFIIQASLAAASIIGSKEHAVRWYDDFVRADVQYRYFGFELMICERVAGMTAVTAGRFDEAERHLSEATRIAAEDPNFLDAPHVDYWFAKMLVERGRPEDRVEATRRATLARAEFARRNMPPYLAMADGLLQEISGA
jgi:tetratricopeptide (TPR) repeat protein